MAFSLSILLRSFFGIQVRQVRKGRAEDFGSGTNPLVAGVSGIRQDRIGTKGFTMESGFATITLPHQAVLRSERESPERRFLLYQNWYHSENALVSS